MAAELVEVYNDEHGFECVKRSYLRFYDLDLQSFDGAISAKAPSYAIRHQNHICYLMHTMRKYYDMFDFVFSSPSERNCAERNLIQALDTSALQPTRTKRIFAIGDEVVKRLWRYNGLRAHVLRHPTSLAGLHDGPFGYLLLPGRLHKWKRCELTIEAMQYVEAPIQLLICGTGVEEERLKALAKNDGRIRFLGHLPDSELIAAYAGALAVVFTPIREDLGLVTQEAFQSGKPVITCIDSGEPARLVRDNETGFVCRPDPKEIAERIGRFINHPGLASEMGSRGRSSIENITWDKVASTIVDALGFASAADNCAQ
ncbi:MAG TPA: glycosyltransferase family 4 protein [Rhizomicrobium sp.]|nr:glycosyltransferase family 4 protein [Rhizomicrobium sp.]